MNEGEQVTGELLYASPEYMNEVLANARRWVYVRDRAQYDIDGNTNEPYVNFYFPPEFQGKTFAEAIDNAMKGNE